MKLKILNFFIACILHNADYLYICGIKFLNTSDMKSFGIEFNGHYVVVPDGCNVVFSNVDKRPCLRKFYRLAEDFSNYVEFWYQYSDGNCILLDYLN